MFDETGDAAKAQGWSPFIVDTNGNGKRDAYVEPNEPVDPAKDKRVGGAAAYEASSSSPVRRLDLAWRSIRGAVTGAVVRVNPGLESAEDGAVRDLRAAVQQSAAPVHGFSPRGIDVDRNGVVWTALSGSGHLASFDRRKCKVLNGPTATGQHCPEGWTLHQTPGPKFKGVTDHGSADLHYFNWVDQFDTFGLGKNMPIANGTQLRFAAGAAARTASSSSCACRIRSASTTAAWTAASTIRRPAGRAGACGRPTAAQRRGTYEGGKGTTSKAVKFQLRPDPLAR